MNEIFLFLTQFVIAYLLLGCLLAAVISLSLRLFSLNAAARHKIWLTALLVLVVAPILSLLPNVALDKSLVMPASENPALTSLVAEEFSLQINESYVLESAKPATDLMSAVAVEEQIAILQLGPVRLEALSQAFVESPLSSELATALFFLLLMGVVAKLFLYARSLRALRVLVESSEVVEGEWADVLAHSSKVMRMSRRTELRHSNRVNTPSTCGVLNPCIILPSTMARDDCFVESRAQVLQHELAHIKRHDPLIAGVQAVVSIFLFWHPAVNYVNKKIRYEREIASDDWVVNNNAQSDSAAVKAYAYSIVDIAESLSRHTTPAHSVACVNNSVGLQNRIRILLDRRTDHSTSVNFMPNVWVASMALGFMFYSSTLLPRLPSSIFQNVKEIEVVELSVLPIAQVMASRESEDRGIELEPITFTVQESVRQIVEYEAPSPIPEFNPIPEEGESTVALALAERIESRLGSRAVEMAHVDSLAIESVRPIQMRVAPVSLDAFIGEQAAVPTAILSYDKSSPAETELVIIDNLSKGELADEIMKIELELYRVFNAVTDRDDLKMYCDSEAILGSYINQTTCEPEFVRTARSQNIGYSMRNTSMLEYNPQKEMQAEYAELAAEILQEMKSNQYMWELYQVLAGLRGRLVELA